MGDHDIHPTCLSSDIHDVEISDYLLHYTGCIDISEREFFFDKKNPMWQDEITYQRDRLIALGRSRELAESTAKTHISEQTRRWDLACKEEMRRTDYLRKIMALDPREEPLVANLDKSRHNWETEEGHFERIEKIKSWRNRMRPDRERAHKEYRNARNHVRQKSHTTPATSPALQPSTFGSYVGNMNNSSSRRPSDGFPGISQPSSPVSPTNSEGGMSLHQENQREEHTGELSEYDPEQDINIYELQYKDSSVQTSQLPHDEGQMNAKTLHSVKHKVKTVLDPDEGKRSPLIQPSESESGLIRYFHLPANNMKWVEQAIAQYYGENRPDYSGIHRDVRSLDKTKAYMILRPQFWRGQQHGGRSALPHARHMRPMCEMISSNPIKADISSQNIVLFMPYLHWDTDRQRDRFAKEIDTITATQRESQSSEAAKRKSERQKLREYLHVEVSKRKLAPPSETKRLKSDRPFESLAIAMGFKPMLPADGRVVVNNNLGQYLIDAARLYEAMNAYRDRKLLLKYLAEDPPLHPRRTLDQAYYWTLNTTKTRDRDQVVYRKTTANSEDFHTWDGKKWPDHEEMRMNPGETCNSCRSNIRKVSRVVMVDQLWMWILDQQTIITSFPKRYGVSKNDASGVHKSIRTRLEGGRQNQIRSVFDLALVIFDECSNTFFDRTKTPDRQPQVIDIFSEAIGNLTNKQTIAFERLWRWTERACNIYRSQGSPDTSELHIGLLDINPEGKLQREIKDILDELEIMLHINRTHYRVLRRFIGHVDDIMNPHGKWGRGHGFGDLHGDLHGRHLPLSPTETGLSSINEDCNSFIDKDALFREGKPPSSFKVKKPRDDAEKAEEYHWFSLNAEELLADVQGRIHELEELKKSAQSTSDSLKDLLALKQQQAGVVQAWQSVKLSEETVNQGHSIMIFTVVTIIFLPLSFMSSIFGMNAVQFGQGGVNILDELKFIFPISLAIIVITLGLAFNRWIRAFIWSGFKIAATKAMVRSHFYEWCRARHKLIRIRPSQWLITEATKKTEKLRKDVQEKMITERWNKRMADVNKARSTPEIITLSNGAACNGHQAKGSAPTNLRKRGNIWEWIPGHGASSEGNKRGFDQGGTEDVELANR